MARPKFKLGQVVFIDDLGFYGLITNVHVAEPPEYALRTSPCIDTVWYVETDLRALNSAEKGRLTGKV